MIFSTSTLHDTDSKIYHCVGFLSDREALKLDQKFDYRHDPAEITIDFRLTRIVGQLGATAIAALVLEYRYLGKAVTLIGLDADSQEVCTHILKAQSSAPQLLAQHLHATLAELVTA